MSLPVEMGVVDPITNEFLCAFAADDLARARSHLRKVKLVTGQVIFEDGDEVDHVYFPEQGLISIVTAMEGSHGVQNTSRGRDGGIGFIEACGSGVMVAQVVVQIGGQAWRLPASRFRALYDTSWHMRALVQSRIEFWLAEARQEIACQAVHPAARRLARMLLECGHHTGCGSFDLTQDFMADMMGVGRTTVTQTASELKRLGLISYTRGAVTLLDPAALQDYACSCYDVVRRLRSRMLAPPVQVRRPRRQPAAQIA